MANDTNTTTPAAADSEAGVHRLTSIVVEEVSLVDHAANKRRFLLLKRSREMAKKQEKKPRGPGARAARQASPARRAAAPAAKAAGDQDDEDETENDDAAKAASEDDEDETEDDDAAKAASEDDEDETEDDDAAKAASEDDEDDEDDDTKKADDEDDEEDEAEKADDEADEDDDTEKADDDSEGASTKRTPGRARDVKADKADDDSEGEADGALALSPEAKTATMRVLAEAVERLMALANRVKDAAPPSADGEDEVPPEVADELAQIGELLEEVADELPTTKALTKSGARMARSRLDRFKQALTSLAHILKELTQTRTLTKPTRAAQAPKAAKREPAELAKLLAEVGDLKQLIQHQGGELAELRKARGVSNAIAVERPRKPAQPVAWPQDMNRPISRDRVDKAVSFYDD